MKQQKNPQGTMVIFLETDLKKSKPVSPEKMSEFQRQVFEKMSETERQKVLDGYGTVVVDLESEKTLCKYNMEHYFPPKHAIESFARQILPDIEEFYSHEENRREFEEWKKQQDKDKGIDK